MSLNLLLILLIALPFVVVGTALIKKEHNEKRKFLNRESRYRATGELVGFRHVDHYGDRSKTIDSERNVPDSKPIIKFLENGKTVSKAALYPTKEYHMKDVGKMVPIICLSIDKKGSGAVIIDNDEQKKLLSIQEADLSKSGATLFTKIGIGIVVFGILIAVAIPFI